MNTIFLIVLRLIHVGAGALWIGAAIVYLFYVKPSVKAIGPAGPQFMQSLTQRQKYPVFMMTVSLLTVIAGSVLYFYASGSFNLVWLKTGVGLGFTIGSVAALIAFLVGSFGIGPTSGQMGELGAQIAASGGPPTAEQLSKMQALDARLRWAETVDFIMLTVAMVTMATARYWVF